MKEIVFLVDTKDSKFVIINNKNNWKLPSLYIKDNFDDKDFLCEKYQRKYHHHIKNITTIEKGDKYVFVKCIKDGELPHKLNHKVGVINEIMLIITNKFHNQLLFNLSIKISFEILNDSFWLGIILTTEDTIKDLTLKALLTDFLLFFSSSFCEEVIIYKFGRIKDSNYVSKNKINELRKRYFKKCPLYNSKSMKNIIEEMGIDFDNCVFDNVLFYIDDELIDINSRTWLNKNKSNFDLYNGVVLSPRRWIKNFYPQLNDRFEEIRKTYVDEFVRRFSEKNVTFKSYVSNNLFDNSLSKNEKIYIMQRIGLLKTTMYFSKIFGNGNFITIKNEEKNIKISFDVFLTKVKAELIELLWNDNCQNSIPFLEKIIENYPNEIPNVFFPINRKCRDNIHYGFYNELTSEELNILNKYQDVYLNYVIKEFEKKLKIKFGVGYEIGLALAQLQYCVSN